MSDIKNVVVKENKLGVKPIVPLIFDMSVPIMVSMLVMALYNIVDSIFVAQINENALTAVSLAFPIQNLLISFAVGTGIGVNALLSLRLGQKNQEDVNKSAGNGIFLAFCTFLLFLIMGLLFIDKYIYSQTDNEQIVAYTRQYLYIIIPFCFPLCAEVMLERLLQGTGRTTLSMTSQLIGAVTNIILDPLFIFGIGPFPKLGISGAALATVLGQVLGMSMAFFFNLKKNHDIQFRFKYLKPDFKIIGLIYKVGVPSIAMNSITSVTTYFINLILSSFKECAETAIAVYGVYFKLNSFIFMPVFGLNNGIVPIIAYNYGARKRKRLTDAIKYDILFAFCIMVIGCVIFETIPDKLFAMFNASPKMLDIGIPALRLIAPSFLGAAVAIALSSVFQAFGNAFYSLIVSFCRQFVVLLPSAMLLSKTGNVNNVWWCFIIAEFMSVGMSCLFCRVIYIRKISKLPLE